MVSARSIGSISLATLMFLVLLTSACGSLSPPEPTATSSATMVPSATPTTTLTPTATPHPSATPTPLPTATPTPLSVDDIFAKNFVALQTRSDVELEIVRLLFARKEILLQGHPQLANERIEPPGFSAPIFEDKPVVGELILRITNTGNEIYTVFPSDLSILIAGNQFRLSDFIIAEAFFSGDANPFNPEILPGGTIVLGYWFGVRDVELPGITEMTIAMEAPLQSLDDGSFLSTGGYYYFEIDLEEHTFEPLTSDIKALLR